MDSEEEVFRDPSDQARIRLTFAQQQLERRSMSSGKTPETIEEILAGLADDRRAYLKVDPWNREIELSHDSGAYELRSAGPDGVFGSLDDVVVTGRTTCGTGCGRKEGAQAPDSAPGLLGEKPPR